MIRRFLVQIESVDNKKTDEEGTQRDYTVSALLVDDDINECAVYAAFERDFSFAEEVIDFNDGLKEVILQELFDKA